MAIFSVDKNVRVLITSSVNAAYPQRFIVERESPTQPGFWEGMGKKIYAGGESASFVPHSAMTTWKITCQNQNGAWGYSRENLTGVGTQQIVIYCDDDTSGDDDFNDIIVRVNLGYFSVGPSGIVAVSPESVDKSKDEDGDGNFKQHKSLKDDPKWTPKKKGDIEP